MTAGAARAGIRAGMTVTEAESRCAGLRVLPWDQVLVDEEVRRATAAFLAASPQVTPVAGTPGLWWIGASGLDASGGELALARALHAIASRWHPDARVAIADSCVAARAATWTMTGDPSPDRDSRFTIHDSRLTILPPGTDAAWLATAPVGLLPMEAPMAEALAALGIRTAGALAALPPGDVEQRWGRGGLTAWRLARGEDRRRPGLATAEYPRTVSADLVPSVDSMEPVLFLVRAALDRLLAGLVADGRAAASLAITLTLDDARGAIGGAPAHTVTREVRLAHPMARLVPLFERCRALLDGWPLPAPACAVTVAVVATAPLTGEQGDLLDPAWHDPAAADATFARLRAELGADAIVVPLAMDEHRPERAGAWVEASTERRAPSAERRAQSAENCRVTSHESRITAHVPPALHDSRFTIHGAVPSRESRVTRHGRDSRFTNHAAPPIPHSPFPIPSSCSRQLEVPEPVDVECIGGTPRILLWRGQRMTLRHPLGPERLAGDWWKDGYVRDYWRCEDPDGEGMLVLYHDYSSGGGWFVQGWDD